MTQAWEGIPAKIVIVGCKGRMGQMLLSRATETGINAVGVDIPFEDSILQDALSGAPLVLLCVPARHLEEVVKKLLPYLPCDCILSDITSVKEGPMRQMEAVWGGPVIGAHPLFGPNNKPGDDLPVALVQGKNATLADAGLVKGFFEKLGCRVFYCGAAEHDSAMAKIQNMNFITNLAYFAAIAGDTELLPFLTPSFEKRKMAAAKLLNEDAEMFAGLFEANGHSHEAVRQYRRFLNLAASGDIELLCKRAQWWWDENSPQNASSLQES